MTKLLSPDEVIKALQDGKEVEVKWSEEHGWEVVLVKHMTLRELINPEHQFRLKQEMITIGNVSFPKPETEPLALGTTYYIPDTSDIDSACNLTWHNDSDDQRFLQYSFVHLIEENAIAHTKALIKLSGGSYE